ncbi:MAG: hypothetical protein M1813_009216 [Trichoglossum hirsutum]|jgi:hypothetical protein|nr:MAG: hypothetical protein M1813_009216 [Trichoglossum hirsutum]
MFAIPDLGRKPATATATSSIILILLVLSISTVASAFRFAPQANFDYCWTHNVSSLNTSDYSDKNQYFEWDSAHLYRINVSQPRITLGFCEQVCGPGYMIWSWDDTLQRITMWVFPAVLLLVHFHFAPLGMGNTCNIILHILGDPLDTLWSLMTRQEVNRRLFRRAKEYSKGDEFRHIATVWSAYDELGWRDPSRETLGLRNPPGPNGEGYAPQGVLQRGLTTASGWVGRPKEYARIPIREGREPTKAELYYIQLASHRLASNRSESQLTTWFAIIGLFIALISAFIRTYSQRSNNQTAHTIAVVALFFILIPIVKISGNMGSFTSTSVAINIIQELRRNLRTLRPDGPQLFPPIRLSEDLRWDYTAGGRDLEMYDGGGESEYENVKVWPNMAPWAGMNNSWRPCKQMLIQDYFSSTDRSTTYLFFLSFLFVMSAYAPALVLSYKTPTVGFSCRSMAWTLILITWLLSAAGDHILKLRTASAKSLWRKTLIKDSCVTFYFILTIITAQIGLFNNCWCRSGALGRRGNAYVSLAPLSQGDWAAAWPLWTITPISFLLFVLALIFTIGRDGDDARTLLSRTEANRQADVLVLTNLRAELERKGELPKSSLSHPEGIQARQTPPPDA